ncbi:hypothetical protein Pst134EA_024344 [Puccinia striiformis f. sp. tritici]|uniref:hypothetical protein n=1 Tax=Puccinia striiformis f. sp. tritici TaxID=168172 RepID=UPI0020080F67|nr:hypothetical protein Pst134EA_024344 [Puccinia striiformis f. sp. tritici]KAH9453472.1 hypothetical protein Pst134EA_024344 [Puccinia striiformis f. sp. tritici]
MASEAAFPLHPEACFSLVALEDVDSRQTCHNPLHEVTEEFLLLLKYAVPIIGTHLLENTLMLVSIVSVGHLGTNELAAASMANITLNCSSLSVIVGFASALDGLCSQSYTSGGLEASTLSALRTAVLLGGLMIPQGLLLWNIHPVLIFLRVDPTLADMAACSLRMLLWSLPGYATFEISRRWLQAQAIIYPPTCILLLVSPLNAILSYLFIWGPESLQLGFIGAPVATVISFNLMGLSCFLYCARVAGQQGWPGCDRRALRDLGPNFCLGLSGFTTLASEWWFWEFIGIASSRLGPTALAAQSVIVTISTLMYQFSGGASLAVAGRYGNLIGGGCTRRAGYASYAALGTGFLFGTLTMLAMVVFRRTLAGLFSSQEEVVALVAKVLPTVAVIQIPDSLGSTLAGVIRGAGKPKVGALINSIGYYVVGLPVGIFLTFSQLQLGIRGLWLGMLMAVTWTAIASSYYVFTKIIPFTTNQLPERQGLIIQNSGLGKASQGPFEDLGDYGTINTW